MESGKRAVFNAEIRILTQLTQHFPRIEIGPTHQTQANAPQNNAKKSAAGAASSEYVRVQVRDQVGCWRSPPVPKWGSHT